MKELSKCKTMNDVWQWFSNHPEVDQVFWRDAISVYAAAVTGVAEKSPNNAKRLSDNAVQHVVAFVASAVGTEIPTGGPDAPPPGPNDDFEKELARRKSGR